MTHENGLFYPDGSFKSRDEIREKHKPSRLFDETTDLLQRAQHLKKEMSAEQDEGVWYPDIDTTKPFAVLFATDIHYGSLRTDYDLLKKHLDIVENTPNFGMITNGDEIDNFTVLGKWASGAYENPLMPQDQALAFLEKLKMLDDKGKIGAISFGNHNNMMFAAGYDFYDTFLRDYKANIFPSGGFLHLVIGDQHYGIAMSHTYWGRSKLNPTNAAKRFWEYEYPQADVAFLGHTHQSEVLSWERGGRERIAVIGGTYKLDDTYAKKLGIGGRGGSPGITLVFNPKEHEMVPFKHIEQAVEYLDSYK
jgi:hypothetical protein